MPAERVVFVHGAGSSGAAAWPRQHGLALDYDCLFLKRRGYGASEDPQPDLAADIALIRDALGEGGHLVAHAAGAVPAMLAALRDPGRVHSLILCEPAVLSLTRDLPATAAHRERLQPLFDAAPTMTDEDFERQSVRRVFAADAAAAGRAARRVRRGPEARRGTPRVPDRVGQSAALIASAASGVTQGVHRVSFSCRKCRAPSSPVAWFSLIQAITPLTVSLLHDRLDR